jgi:hypothetical protein
MYSVYDQLRRHAVPADSDNTGQSAVLIDQCLIDQCTCCTAPHFAQYAEHSVYYPGPERGVTPLSVAMLGYDR